MDGCGPKKNKPPTFGATKLQKGTTKEVEQKCLRLESSITELDGALSLVFLSFLNKIRWCVLQLSTRVIRTKKLVIEKCHDWQSEVAWYLKI